MKKPITRSSTLFRQFVLSLTFPVLLAFMLAGLGTVWITWSQQQSDLALQKESMLQSYREALVKPLWDCDNNTVEPALFMSTKKYAPGSAGSLQQCVQPSPSLIFVL